MLPPLKTLWRATLGAQAAICSPCLVHVSPCLISRNQWSKHGSKQRVFRDQIKSAERPTTGRFPTMRTVLFVKQLDFWLMQSFEFSLDNSEAIYSGYYSHGLQIRFYVIVYRLFCFCTVKGYQTGLQQWSVWRGRRVRASPLAS